MTQNLYITQLQQFLNQLIDETMSTAAGLAQKSSQIIDHSHIQQNKGVKLSSLERTAIQLEIQSALQQSHSSHGIGFASYSPTTQIEQDYWTLEWWYKQENQLQQAQFENYQNTQRFLDFRSFEWFQLPAKTQQPYVHGPYVDYICNDAYTITIAYPVMQNNQFLGVIAIDILVATLEQMILPKLKNIEQKAVIINQNSRVIASNDVSIRTGTLLKDPPQPHTYNAAQHPIQLVVLS
ncbi:PDC sensor domain-containing protein [Acinetobacter rudis]|uniref:Cache domain-containing protein n=1 Tax=Acinetobacter rudis TaxID=632955 RepID=A0AAW8J5Q4_9GAMM|nr:cache domain-containing protein [Acinetobacter rudis]MDQ8934541.1 cache domain-containing protein [Acinetobacter rudis]MDQ9016889.1 cache domain-containing protein [Acinetobacter rudis]